MPPINFKIVLFILGWYSVSMTITFTNKHLLTDRGFENPFVLATCNNVMVFALVFLITRAPSLRPPPLPMETLLRVVFPIGLLTALDIGCANWALVHLSVAFHTIIRGSIPAFVLVFALILRLDQPSWRVALSIVLVVSGCGLASWGELTCDAVGLTLVLLSCAFSGLRWALTQVLVQGGPDSAAASVLDKRASPLASIYYVSPACALSSAVGALTLERKALRSPQLYELGPILCAIALLVFVLLFCEFGLVRATSSLSLSVLGVVKELITILIAGGLRGDIITPTNFSGFLLCAAGILIYHVAQATKAEAMRVSAAEGGGGSGRGCDGGEGAHQSVELTRADGSADDDDASSAAGGGTGGSARLALPSARSGLRNGVAVGDGVAGASPRETGSLLVRGGPEAFDLADGGGMSDGDGADGGDAVARPLVAKAKVSPRG